MSSDIAPPTLKANIAFVGKNGHLQNEIDFAASESFERHESFHTKPQFDPLVFRVWSRRERVGLRPNLKLGLCHWPFVLGAHGWLQMVVIRIVVPETDIFASSTGEFNFITNSSLSK